MRTRDTAEDRKRRLFVLWVAAAAGALVADIVFGGFGILLWWLGGGALGFMLGEHCEQLKQGERE